MNIGCIDGLVLHSPQQQQQQQQGRAAPGPAEDGAPAVDAA
jgi:hypothetical protein